MAISIGGFFATLNLKKDKASFDEANKDMKKLGAETKQTGAEFMSFTSGAIKGLLALGAAALGSAYAVTNIQGKMTLTAKQAGMGYTEFTKLSSAMKLVGLDSSGVANKLSTVNQALADYKVGLNTPAYESLATNLALMGINVNDFAKMSGTQRIEAVAGKAEAARGTDKERSYIDLADAILGIGDMLMKEQTAGTKYPTTKALLAAGANSAWATSEKDITKNNEAFNSLTNQMDQMWKEFGEKMGNGFRPIINDISDYLAKHKDEITSFFTDLGNVLLITVRALEPFVKTVGDFLNSTVGQTVVSIASGEELKERRLKDKAVTERVTNSVYDTEAKYKIPRIQANASTLAALKMEEQGAAYTQNATAEAKKQFAGSSTATQVTIGDINLTGTDFNQFLNYMVANPGANKTTVAVAALAAINNMGLTK